MATIITAEARAHLVNALESHYDEILGEKVGENYVRYSSTDDENKIARDRKGSDVACESIYEAQ